MTEGDLGWWLVYLQLRINEELFPIAVGLLIPADNSERVTNEPDRLPLDLTRNPEN